MLLDAETRRRGETRGEHLFRIGFRACKATQESQNLGARRQRRLYGFAARLSLGWKADQRSARRIPQRGLVHRSEEHTSELQSLRHLVCRLLLEKKKRN